MRTFIAFSIMWFSSWLEKYSGVEYLFEEEWAMSILVVALIVVIAQDIKELLK